MPTGQRWTVFLVTLLLCVSLDQWSKVYAIQHWKGEPAQSFLGDMFRIEYAENDGAFLSLLADFSSDVRFWVLVVGNSAVLLGLSIYILTTKQMEFSHFLPLTLLVAGGLGNLIDRVRFLCVIDYFNVGIGSLRTGIFNVADMAITGGFLLLVPYIFYGEKSSTSDETGAPEAVNVA